MTELGDKQSEISLHTLTYILFAEDAPMSVVWGIEKPEDGFSRRNITNLGFILKNHSLHITEGHLSVPQITQKE